MSYPNEPAAPPAAAFPATPPVAAARPKRTLREVLIASHAGLVAVVVALFAGTIYWMTGRAVYRQSEADLLAAAEILLRELDEGTAPPALRIPDTYFHRFGPAPRDQADFILWDAQGTRLAASHNAAADILPLARPPRRDGPHPFETLAAGTRLDVVVATPAGGQLRIGRSLAKEFDGQRWLALRLVVGGGLALALGAAAAAWLADRISAPLARMTRAAERVTSRNLRERLETGPATAEVSRLAAVFNGMLAELEASFERQTRFTADASHELRTPVAVILSQAEHTLSRDRAPEEYRAALGTCRDAARRMKRLVDDLLLLTRADAGSLPCRRDPLDLAEIAGDVTRLLQPLAREREIRLSTRLASAPLIGDAGHLGQVVTNLVTNAIRYNHAGGEVQVTVEPGRSPSGAADAVLEVQDQGPGIPPGIQETLFDRFTRGDAARTLAGEEGTGLGLSIVREIVTAHGGTVAVRSRPETGTTLTVRLPAARPVPTGLP